MLLTLLTSMGLSVALNVTLSLAIIFRMLYVRKTIEQLGADHGRIYTSIASMFFESGVLYTTMALVYFGLVASGSHLRLPVFMLLGQTVVCDFEVLF